MKDKRFTDQEVKILLQNENILKVGSSNVTYKPDFKIKAVKEYNNGKTPIQIFVQAGIPLDILGRENAKRSLSRWKKTYKKLGDKGLIEEQRGQGKGGGRPSTKPLSPEEEIKYLKARNAYLEAENEFLKKLKALERGGR